MNLLSAVILGVVQGLTEFLPISSTGHLVLVSKILHLPPSEFLSSFEIIIQLGSILAVLVIYGKRLFKDVRLLKRLIAAFLPTAMAGFLLYRVVKHYLLASSTVVLASLFLGGIAIIVFELRWRGKEGPKEDLSGLRYRDCVLIGLFQALAMIPGVSRSAATIIGGLLLGMKRRAIVEFSFLLAVPTMLAATALDLIKNGVSFSPSDWQCLGAGFLVSFVVAMLAIRFLLSFIKKHSFIPFGIYRIVFSALFFFLFVR